MNPNHPNLPSASPQIPSAFHPIHIRQNSCNNMMKSLVTPLLEKSPLLLQSGLDGCFRSSYFENSALTNKESTLPTKLEGDSRNPMIIKFDSFSPKINKSNSSQQKIVHK